MKSKKHQTPPRPESKVYDDDDDDNDVKTAIMTTSLE